MRIGEAAKAAGVGLETLRFYEREGLVEQPGRPARGAGFRSYSVKTVDRIRFIRRAQEIGFSLREIKELLSLLLDSNADCGEVRARAQSKLDDVNGKIASLTEMQIVLGELIDACPGRGAALGKCAILETLTSNTLDSQGA